MGVSVTNGNYGKLRILVEAAGAGAVLLGLIFVGFELNQNTAAVSAQAIFQLNESANVGLLAIAQDPALAELVDKGNEDPELLSDIERQMFIGWMRVRLNGLEAGWFYHKKGLIDDSDMAGVKGATCETLSLKGARWFWDNDFGNHADGFVEGAEKWCGFTTE